MICLYEYFVLRETNLLSSYLAQATTNNIAEFNCADNTCKEGVFATIMKTYKNKVVSRENAVVAGDFFCSFLWQALKKPKDMTPKAFKVCFGVLMKLYKDLEADFELIICKRERKLIFNAFSTEHQNEFVAQQKKDAKLSIDDFVNYFQILHAQEAPHCEQKHHEDKEKQACKEANQERDAANKGNTSHKHKSDGYNDSACKQPHQEINLCCICQGMYDILQAS